MRSTQAIAFSMAALSCGVPVASGVCPPDSILGTSTRKTQQWPLPSQGNHPAFVLRGGASSSSSSSKKTKKKKKKSTGKAKKAIDDAMKEKDAAEALGDAIR